MTERAQIDLILVADRHRQPSPAKVVQLARSMSEIGLRTPITVELVADDDERPVYSLVAGYSRLLAAKSLGWEEIPVDVQEFDSPEHAELWEIDENLMRGELSPAEEAAHLARRKELFALIGGQNLAGKPQHEKAFAADTAERTGRAKSGINQKLARAAALGDDLGDVIGTSLDKGTELDALAKMEPEVRRRLIGEARRGSRVSAVREIKSDFDVVQEEKNALVRLWNRTGPEARVWFREFIDTPVMDRGAA